MDFLNNKVRDRRATAEVGIAIIAMAILLLLGGIFVDSDSSSKDDFFSSKGESISDNNIDDDLDSNWEDSYLFYMYDTEIGRQRKVTQSFPNIDLGSKQEFNVVYLGNSFELMANPFSRTRYNFDVYFEDSDDVNYYMLYFNFDRESGEQALIIRADDDIVYQNMVTSSDLPIIINKKFYNDSSKVSFELLKPKWYDIFNWNKFSVSSFKVVSVTQDRSNNEKDFTFEVNKGFLERVELNIVVSCDDGDKGDKPVKVTVNEYTIADFNPNCEDYINSETREIPLTILSNKINNLVFETSGFYKLSYSINKIYYNDEDTYSFQINSFNDIIDVVMYGDFDEEVLDLRINSQTLALERDEIMSIIPYLRFGSNEIKFLTKPIEIDEFIIEKNEFLY